MHLTPLVALNIVKVVMCGLDVLNVYWEGEGEGEGEGGVCVCVGGGDRDRGREGRCEGEGGWCMSQSLTQLMSIEEVFMEHLKVQLRPSL